jgi:hypothetical protein
MTQNEMKTFQLILKETGAEMTKALRNRDDGKSLIRFCVEKVPLPHVR